MPNCFVRVTTARFFKNWHWKLDLSKHNLFFVCFQNQKVFFSCWFRSIRNRNLNFLVWFRLQQNRILDLMGFFDRINWSQKNINLKVCIQVKFAYKKYTLNVETIFLIPVASVPLCTRISYIHPVLLNQNQDSRKPFWFQFTRTRILLPFQFPAG